MDNRSLQQDPLREIIIRRGINITDDNADDVLSLLKENDVTNESELNKLHRSLLAEKAVSTVAPILTGGMASVIGGPGLGIIASTATSSAMNASGDSSVKGRIKSVAASFATSFVSGGIGQPLIDAGGQLLAKSSNPLSNDLPWLDGSDIPKLQALLEAHAVPYGKRLRAFGERLAETPTSPTVALGALKKATSHFVNEALPHSGAVAEELIGSVARQLPPLRIPSRSNSYQEQDVEMTPLSPTGKTIFHEMRNESPIAETSNDEPASPRYQYIKDHPISPETSNENTLGR